MATDTARIMGVLSFFLAFVLLIAVLLISNGAMNLARAEAFGADGGADGAPPQHKFMVVLVKMEGCGACASFAPTYARASAAASAYFKEKPNCPRFVRFREVDVYSSDLKTFLSAGLPRPTGVPHVAIFSEGPKLKWLASLPEDSYTYRGILEWVNQATDVEKCSGWLAMSLR